MTILEQRFMQQVPDLLHDIAKGVQAIADQTPRQVYVFTAEQAYEGDTFDVVVRVFASEESARKFLHSFVYAPASDGNLVGIDVEDESLAEYVRQNEWDVETDEPDFYKAYEPGYYMHGHIECRITRCETQK